MRQSGLQIDPTLDADYNRFISTINPLADKLHKAMMAGKETEANSKYRVHIKEGLNNPELALHQIATSPTRGHFIDEYIGETDAQIFRELIPQKQEKFVPVFLEQHGEAWMKKVIEKAHRFVSADGRREEHGGQWTGGQYRPLSRIILESQEASLLPGKSLPSRPTVSINATSGGAYTGSRQR